MQHYFELRTHTLGQRSGEHAPKFPVKWLCLSGLHMILLTACPILMNELERDKVWGRMMLVATKRVSLALCHNMSYGSRGSREPGFFHALLASPSGI